MQRSHTGSGARRATNRAKSALLPAQKPKAPTPAASRLVEEGISRQGRASSICPNENSQNGLSTAPSTRLFLFAANGAFDILRFSDKWRWQVAGAIRSDEHTSALQSLMRISYAVFCLKQ